MLRIALIGDVVGKPGRRAVAELVPLLRKRLGFDMLVANAENCAGGKGITPDTVRELLAAGVDVITTGDHVFDQKNAADALAEPRVVRPLNYPPGAPGRGWTVVNSAAGVPVAVMNVMGRVFMKPADCPFRAVEQVLADVRAAARIVLVDMHAEATSEKIAMGWFLDGRVAAVCGSHTHVLTADARVLPHGTAYITDLGMTGAHHSVLGRDVTAVLAHFITGLPQRFELAEHDVRLNGALIDIDETTGTACAITTIQEALPPAERAAP